MNLGLSCEMRYRLGFIVAEWKVRGAARKEQIPRFGRNDKWAMGQGRQLGDGRFDVQQKRRAFAARH